MPLDAPPRAGSHGVRRSRDGPRLENNNEQRQTMSTFAIRTRFFSIAFAILVMAAPSFAHAQASNTVFACVQASSGQTRIVGANEMCRGTETRISWGIAGQK